MIYAVIVDCESLNIKLAIDCAVRNTLVGVLHVLEFYPDFSASYKNLG